MPQIRMKTTIAGPKYNCHAGNVINVDIKTARLLINGGYAEYLKQEEKVESAMVEPKENATRKTARGRGKK